MEFSLIYSRQVFNQWNYTYESAERNILIVPLQDYQDQSEMQIDNAAFGKYV
jgi:hypothetical protein